MTKLKLCPFCGGKVSIVLCDDEANLHDETYREHPYSGLGFMLHHAHEENRNVRLQAMSAMAGFWVVYIFTTRKNKPLKHGIGDLKIMMKVHFGNMASGYTSTIET